MFARLLGCAVLVALATVLPAGCQSAGQSQSAWTPPSQTRTDEPVKPARSAVADSSKSAKEASKPGESPDNFVGESIAAFPVRREKIHIAVAPKTTGGG